MDNFLHEKPAEKSRFGGVIIGAVLAAVALVAGGVWLLTFVPSNTDLKQKELVGAVFEGSPEFDEYTKQLIITTDFDRTSQAKLPIGTIHMSIYGSIRNKGTKRINGLEISVAVIDQKNQILKEKKTMIVPGQAELLPPNTTIPAFIAMDGFKPEDDRANIRWKVTAIRFE